MNITLIQEQMAYIELTLETEDEFEVYGGTTRAPFEFIPTGVASWRVIVRESEVAGAAIRSFDIYALQRSTGREWVVLSGRIFVKPRTADIEGDKLSPVEYHVTVPVVDSVVDTLGMAIVTGIPGPRGPQGEKGDPGDGAINVEEVTEIASEVATTIVTTHAQDASLHVSAESIKSVVPINWGAYTESITATGNWSIALGASSKAEGSYALALGASSNAGKQYTLAVGSDAKTYDLTGVTVGIGFAEYVDGKYIMRTCQTQGTGSITIGAGANTKNNGDTESSNSVTIGCKALNQGADSVVIGASAKNEKAGNTIIGTGAKATDDHGAAIGNFSVSGYLSFAAGHSANAGGFYCVALGKQSSAGSEYAVALGAETKASHKYATAIGAQAKVSDYGATVIRSTAEDGTYTQLYFSGANTPLANTYENGAPMLGYVTMQKNAEGKYEPVAAGTRSLIELLTNNSTFSPASLDENGEWVMPKVFHPSDLDMPTEEPSEVEEYTPLPVYPIVEPEVDELRTPTGEN